MRFWNNINRSELEVLSKDRPEETVETFSPNDFYGHATLLKRYCGLSPDFIINGIIPHGPKLSDNVWRVGLQHCQTSPRVAWSIPECRPSHRLFQPVLYLVPHRALPFGHRLRHPRSGSPRLEEGNSRSAKEEEACSAPPTPSGKSEEENQQTDTKNTHRTVTASLVA